MSPQTFLLLVGLAVLVLLAARLGFGQGRLPSMLHPLVETGTVFILIGAALGPSGANLLSPEMLEQISPILIIGLGWVGFLYGSHLEWRLLRRYPGRMYAATLVEAGVTFALVYAAVWWLLGWWSEATPWSGGPLSHSTRMATTLVLAICAAGTAPAGVFLLSRARRINQGDLNLLQFMAALDDLPGLVLLGLSAWWLHPAAPPVALAALGGAAWPLLAVGLGVGLGLTAHWLYPYLENIRHSTLILLGVVSLGAGAAASLSLSPLFVTAVGGAVFANLSQRKESAYGLLAREEHAIYAVCLLVAGVRTHFEGGGVLLLFVLYFAARTAGKLAGGHGAVRLLRAGGTRASPLLGMGLIYQGGITLALAVSFNHIHPGQVPGSVLTALVLSVVANELLGPLLARRMLRRTRP